MQRIINEKEYWVVPAGVRWRVLNSYHDEREHFALDKTLNQIKQHFWFPRMRQYVKKFIKYCIQCCFNKRKGGKIEGELHVLDTKPVPFHTIHMNHLEPFPVSSSKCEYVIVICDSFTIY